MTDNQPAADPSALSDSERRLMQEIAALRAQINILERTHDPSIVPNRTGNIIGLITLMVVLLGIGGGSSLFLQLNQIDRVDTKMSEIDNRLDSQIEQVRERIEGYTRDLRAEMDRTFTAMRETQRSDLTAFRSDFESLETELRERYARTDQIRTVSLELPEAIYRFRVAAPDYCEAQTQISVVNQTPYLTEIVVTRVYYKAPLMTGKPFPVDGWDSLSTYVPPADSYLRILAGHDRLPNFLTMRVDQTQMADFLAVWTPEREFPLRYDLAYLRTGQETQTIVLERNIRVDAEFADCVRAMQQRLQPPSP
jgi:hypothetical protein